MKVFTRAAGLLVLGALLLIGPSSSTAATPAAGTIGPSSPSVTWTGGPYVIPTPVPDACPPASDPLNARCDHFYLTVNVPASYWSSNHGGADIQITWADPNDDFDLFIYDNAGNLVGQSASGGTTSERFLVQNANSGQSPYEVRVVPFLAAAATYNGSATFVSAAGAGVGPPRATGGLTFSPPATVADPQRTEGEPLNWIDQNGAYWESGPWGVSTQQSFIHRSTDGGNQFNIVSPIGTRPDAGPGGGDTDVITDDQGYAYFTDLESLLNLDCAVSNDNGQSWRRNSVCVGTVGDDRQWFTVDNGLTGGAGDNTIFLGYREETGIHIYSTPGSTGPLDPVGGFLYVDSADTPLALQGNPRCGQLRFDPVRRNIYYPCSAGNHVVVTIGHVNPGQRTGIHYKNVDLPVSPGGGGVDDLFPVVAADRAGNVYMAWVDTNNNDVYYSFSTNGGDTWSTPRQVSGNDANSNVMPWIQGGLNGTVVVAWYGNASNVDSDLMPSWYVNRQLSTPYKWYGYASVITNATGATPTFAQQKFTDQPMHYGQICTGGLGCTTNSGDRTMADFFGFVLDRNDGAIRVIFNDTTSQHHGAHLFEVRQVGGPSATGGTVNRAVPTNPVGDPTGDAQSPHYVPAGPGPNLPKFDFTQLRLSRPNAATLRVQMTLNNLSDPATPAGKTNSLWLTRFQALSRGDEGEEAYRIFYVGMEKVGNGAPSFFAGSGDSNNNGVPGDGCVNTTPENCKIVEYPAEQVVTGSVSGNTITIDVPIQGGFGSTVAARPILSNTLYNVTALSAGRNGSPTNPVDIHADLDATKAFDYPLTSGGNPPPPPPPPHCDNDTGHHDHGAGEFDDHGHHGQFSMNACDRGHEDREKVHYKEDGGSNDFRSTRTDSITHSGNTATITGAGIHAGQQVTFTVTAVNNGTTGDVFSLTLSDGFARSGTLTSGDIKGS